MTLPAPPTLDALAARRWRDLPKNAVPWLHEEVAQRMMARLDYIKAVPERWLDWAPQTGGWQAHEQLQARFPNAQVWVWESAAERARTSAARLSAPWWSAARWRRGRVNVFSRGLLGVDMLWANMGLHADPAPVQTMAHWHDALKAGGFLMFSCLGPDTLTELRQAYRDLHWPAPCHAWTDMHDLGDMLVSVGFAEPVMSMERISLTYSSAKALLGEMRGLGRNLSRDRFQSLRGRGWRDRLTSELGLRLADPAHNGRLALSFELIYGHAVKPLQDPGSLSASQATVSLEAMRAALAESRNRKT